MEEIEIATGPKYPMAWRSCNITSLCMILHYWGLTQETPNQMIERVYAKPKDEKDKKWGWLYEATVEIKGQTRTGAARLENWSVLKEIAELYTSGKEGYKVIQKAGLLTINYLQEQISKGFPVMISTGLGSLYGSNETDGHIVVVRGFTVDGDVILNDPYGIPVDNDNRVRQSGEKNQIYGYYYNSEAASPGDNIVIDKNDFKERYAKNSNEQYLCIEGPLWQEPGGTETDISNSYPIRSDNMWHDGIHLESAEGFHSIGPGRLVADDYAEIPGTRRK